jgi:uncharacterized protein
MAKLVKMKNILFVYLLFLISGCIERSPNQGTGNLLGSDYRLFQNTPAWGLAKAVRDQDVNKIEKIVREEKVDIDYQEPKFGKTLLMLTILNEQYNSCRTLLELGADPNKHDHYDGSSAIIEAAGINGTNDDNTKFLKILLKYRANPNDEEIGNRRKGNTTRNTPLLVACGSPNKIVSPIEKVKILVEAGANINHNNEFNQSALSEALLLDHYDIVIYLLKKGVNYKMIVNTDINGKNYYIWEDLRFKLLPLDSKEYKQKMQIIEFLKQKGIDYRKSPIPDYTIKEAKEMYPENWREYLKKY